MEDNKNTTSAELSDLATEYMMIYGVNVSRLRSIPFIVDGLKPIHRRILYALYKEPGDKDTFHKVASAMGSTLHYSPHGDQGMNDTFARMAQPFSNNAPYLTPDGNCGTATNGDDCAAERYWDVRISDFARDVLFKEFDGKVNMLPNYDYSRTEPFYLPARFPTVLLNGTDGIAYTMMSDIPPFNVSEVADATLKLLQNPDAKINLVPDSPTGCDIIVRDKETFVFQSKFEMDNRNYTITITHTAYGKYLRKIQKEIYKIQNGDSPMNEILSADDESDLIEGKIALVIRCKPCNLYTVVNKLFKRIPQLRNAVSLKNVLVIDTTLRTLTLTPKQILLRWLEIRFNDKRNWLMRELVSKTQRYNILDGKAYMLNEENIDKTTHLVLKTNKKDLVDALVKLYHPHISSAQANAIADTRIGNLTADEFKKTIEEMRKINEEIKSLRDTLSTPEKIKESIADDIKEIKAKYGVPRRSKILNLDNTERSNVGVVQILTDGSVVFGETETPDHLSSDVYPVSGDMVCLIDDMAQFVWINTEKVDSGTPMTLTSIGKSVMGKCLVAVSNKSNDILLLTNHGRVKYMPISKIPSNISRKPLIPLNDGERVVSIIELRDESQDVLIYTSDGMGKRVRTSDISKMSSVDAQGQFLIKDVDNVSGMFCVDNKKPLLVYVTLLGKMRVNNVKHLVSGKKYSDMKPIITLSPQDDLVGVYCVSENDVVTLYHGDGRISTVNVKSLPVSTMAIPPNRPKHVPAVKVIRTVIS